MITFGSLFAGIGGIDLGLERAGMVCKWQVEIDPYCNAVLEKHWPHVPRYQDVREVSARTLEAVDCIAGGFPCQDISVAGKRVGLAGSRSGLWSEFKRIIEEMRPEYVIIENVYAGWRTYVPTVRRDLFGLGYATLPIRMRASDFGAPHQRARCFIVGHRLTDTGSEIVRIEQRGSVRAHGSRTSFTRNDGTPQPMADTAGERFARARALELSRGRTGIERDPWWITEPDVGRVAHGVPNRVDRLRSLGNAVVPQKVEWLARQLLEL